MYKNTPKFTNIFAILQKLEQNQEECRRIRENYVKNISGFVLSKLTIYLNHLGVIFINEVFFL